jgi:hypothetical protein
MSNGNSRWNVLPYPTLLHADGSVHHLNQAFGDAQAQSCSAVAARGGTIRLDKRLKDLLLLLGTHSNAGIRNTEMQIHGGRLSGDAAEIHFQEDLAGVGKLQRVAHEIVDNLPQATGIAN